MLNTLSFIFSNYIFVIITSVLFALVFNYDKKYDDDEIFNAMKAKQETQAITREIILINLFMITIVRLHFMKLGENDTLRLMIAGTFGTLLLRTFMTNVAKIFGIIYMTKLKDKISKNNES